MSSVQNPKLKKQLAYERDHYSKGKYDKRFRKAWPKIKRAMVRATRHVANQMVTPAANDFDVVIPDKPKTKHRLRKRGSSTLREIVERKMERRTKGVGAKKRRALRQAPNPEGCIAAEPGARGNRK
jgi:hypothetical protein